MGASLVPIVTNGPALEPENKGIDEFHAGRMESLGAAVSEALMDLPTAQMSGMLQVDRAAGNEIDFGELATGIATPTLSTGPGIAEATKPAISRIDIMDANHRVKQAGLAQHLKLPDQPDIPQSQLEIMMSRARARRDVEATMERGPGGVVQGALEMGTSFLVSAVDPLNLASAFVPVMGELRYAKMLAGAGEGALARSGVRAAVGAAEGAVGQAALEPLDWYAHTQDGRDFGMADVLHNIMFGAVLGGALHSGGGAVSDIYRARKERPMYPYDLGEPLESHTPWDELRTRQQQPLPRDIGEFPGLHEPIFPEAAEDWHITAARLAEESRQRLPDVPSEAVQTIDDLPQRAREDAARIGIANLIEGEPLRAGEALEAAARTDPRIAESFEAWHGSPHDFDEFNLSKIGTGEGAQAYGHGFYFAENEAVARQYQRATSDKAFVNKVAELYDEGFAPGDAWAEIKDNFKDFSSAEQRLMMALEKDDWLGFDYPHQAVSAALRDIKRFDVSPETEAAARAVGNMYKVSIKGDPGRFLDWDKPLGEQSAFIRGLLEPLGYRSEQTGKEIYQSLIKYRPNEGGATNSGGIKLSDLDATPEAASGRMSATGIAGIKYLDQDSRKVGEGTRNFVVFNDKNIEIIGKNGEPVTPQRVEAEARAEAQPEAVKAKAPRGRAAADPQTWSLYEFLAHEGGLRPDQELAAIIGGAKPFVPGFGALMRPTGRTLDDALRLAKDHGYLFDAADVTGNEGKVAIRDLLDKIADENSGRKQYRFDQEFGTKAETAAALEREKHEILSLLHDEIEAATGQKGAKVDPKLEDRVVQIIQREGESDVLAAYERAIMEDAERYDGLASERQKHVETAYIPGWDAPVTDAASEAGRTGARERGQAGLPVDRSGRADGGQSRAAGQGNRAPVPTQLNRDAAWRALSHQTPEFNDPAVIAASNAAAEVKRPPTKLDERLTAAEKADAYAQQMYDMFKDRLPEGDRLRLDDLIKTIESDNEARSIAIERGGACLFGARE